VGVQVDAELDALHHLVRARARVRVRGRVRVKVRVKVPSVPSCCVRYG